jgi:sortase A
MPYVYLKKSPRSETRVKSLFLSSLFLGGGIFLLLLVIWPILTFELLFAPKFTANVVSPIPEEQVLGTQTDLIQASNWFPTAMKRSEPSKITSYTLSIPKLGISDAVAIIGAEDLSKSLIQWGGTALPGEFGNTVIFGHSVLPTFFNPKNYTTIFSTLPTLEEKDEIFVYFDGITYKYQVFEMKVVEPQDISVLEQKYDDSYISLITCVPPGTYWKRLVVKARLVKI